MRRIASSSCFLLALAAPAPASAALRWDAPRDLARGIDGPQVAVNARGAVVASWFSTGLKARVAIAERGRAPGRAQLLDPRGRPIAPAISRTGRAVAAWSRPREIRVAFRAAGASRFGSARRIGRLRDDGVLADVYVLIDDTGAGVVVWSDFVRLGGGRSEDRLSLRAFDARGRFGPELRFGEGNLARPAADPATGRVAVAWSTDAGAASVIERPGRDQPFAGAVQLADKGAADTSVALGPGGATAVGWTAITTRGDAGARGDPTIRVRAAGATGFAPAVAVPTGGHANRFFRPYVAFMGATPSSSTSARRGSPASASSRRSRSGH